MKLFLFSAALALFASSNVHATEALFFNGGGYTIEVLIGFLDGPSLPKFALQPVATKTRLFPRSFFVLKSSI